MIRDLCKLNSSLSELTNICKVNDKNSSNAGNSNNINNNNNNGGTIEYSNKKMSNMFIQKKIQTSNSYKKLL